ncbi:unnamed protein product [Cochlearia groenlandica]
MESDNGKLFVGGISWDTDEERLKEYFSSFGEVIEAVILKDRTTGRARGFGFVVFADPNVAEIVITEKHSIDGRLVEAKKAVPRDDQNIVIRSNSSSIQGSPGGPCRTRKIFVGGLPSSVTESDFKDYFEQFGTTTDVVVMYDHSTQRPRGFGFITYDTEEAVEKVLLKTFHELNGKMVEVKRAVPKELSPSPSRSPLGGGLGSYSYGVNRVNNLINGYAQGFNPAPVNGYGLRMDGRFSPVGGGRSGFVNYGSGYGMNVNFEQGMPTGFTGGSSFNGNVDYGRGMSPYYVGNTNRFIPAVGYEGGNGGGNSSFFSSVTRNLWGNNNNNAGHNYNNNATNSNSNTYTGGSTSGNNTLNGQFSNSRVNWGAPGRGNNAAGDENVKFGYGGNGESGFGYNRVANRAAPSSSFSSSSVSNNTGYNAEGLAEFYGNGDAVYSDPTWRSSASETEGHASFSYGIGGGGGHSSNVAARSSSPGYIGVNKRQPNRGNLSFKSNTCFKYAITCLKNAMNIVFICSWNKETR